MKKVWKVLIIIAVSICVAFHAINLICLISNLLEESWFEQYRKDFDLINEYVIDNFECPANEKYEIVSFVSDEDGEISSLYCNDEYYPLSDQLKNAFSRMISLAQGKNLDTIRISSEQIDYFGLGNRAFVYSRDGKRPKYLYSEDEHLLGFGAGNAVVSAKFGGAIGTAVAPGVGTVAGIVMGILIGYATEEVNINGKSAKEWADTFADWAIDGIKKWFD